MPISNLKVFLYGFYRWIYRKTSAYKNDQEIAISIKEKEQSLTLEILNKLGLENEITVLNGPFQGMKYLNTSSGSMLVPKIIGSYEEPIHKWLYNLLELKEYTKIIDIGCAEGYYAVGFGKSLTSTKIVACDINEKALESARALANLNQVNAIEFVDFIDHEFLNYHVNSSTLIFCDIEGYELALLDPKKCEKLKICDLLVEVHDCFTPGIQNTLIKRFQPTHSIEIVYDYTERMKEYQLDKLNSKEHQFAINEKRPKGISWMFLKPF